MVSENEQGQPIDEQPQTPALQSEAVQNPGASDPGTAAGSPVNPPAGGAPAQPAAAAARPSRKEMTPEERAAAIKAAQEKALRLKAEREAAKAAAEGGGTAVATAEAAPAPTGPVWRIPAAGAQGVTVARPDATQVVAVERETREVRVIMQRRQALRAGVFSSLFGLIFLMVGSFLNFFNPRHIAGFGGIVAISKDNLPKQGDDPKKFFDMKGYLVFLKPDEGGHGAIPGSKTGGMLALYQKCVHLGCTVPWRPEFDFEGTKGWFRCPCHGSTYTKGGARVFGPAPRSLDTFDLAFTPQGGVLVNTGKITLGDVSDPQRAKLPPA
jgi:cytochrome b6-f complex iron-sulfur subunit